MTNRTHSGCLGRKTALVVFTGALLFAGNISAEAPRGPSDTEIQQQMQKNRSLTKETFDKADMEMKAGVPRLNIPEESLHQKGVDVEEIVKKYQAMQRGEEAQAAGPRVYVFVSFSMPEQSIARVMREAQKSGGVVVLRGMIGKTLKETTAKLREIAEKYGTPSVQIDPTKFTNYAITAVPTTVLAVGEDPKCNQGKCSTPGEFYSVEGDVSLEFALDEIVRLRPAAKEHAKSFLSRLKSGSTEGS